MFKKLFGAVIVFGIKFLTLIFYRIEAHWLTPLDKIHWDELKVLIALNHTSLFEFLFGAAIPNQRLWRALDRLVVPVADVTLDRPIAGKFFRLLVPLAVPITRKRDDSWSHFMSLVGGKALILIFPEGRMKRLDGLDKYGKPMSVKRGIADILEKINTGKILIAYSGGLHHVQAPGQILPRLFKTIRIAFEELDVQEYKKSMQNSENTDFSEAVIHDLESRMKRNCPDEKPQKNV